MSLLAILGTSTYAYAIFAAVPFASGFTAAYLINFAKPVAVSDAVVATFLSLLLQVVVIMLFLVEGLICILMAAPLIAIFAVLGCAAGRAFANSQRRRRSGPPMMLSVFALLPALLMAEARQMISPAQGRVQSELVIEAPPEKIWEYLVELDSLPQPKELLFRAGIAHPIATSTEGSGVGSRRSCVLSTGLMEEVIEVWEPGRALQFKVLRTPPTMKELNPFGEVRPAHLEGYYNCRRGRFDLIALPGGRTKLVGTSWYEFKIFPAAYWSMWTNKIVSDVQLRVMREIKRRAEAL